MINSNIEIKLISNHWIDFKDDEDDLCSHGQVRVIIGKEVIVDGRKKESNWSTSAMAIHLLRTLDKNHNKDNMVGEHLIPCCGHHIDHLEDKENVHIQGCFTGYNFWVEHQNNKVILTTDNNTKIEVQFSDYKREVIQFVDSVEELYKVSSPKKLPKDVYDRKGYELMRQEWRTRRNKWN
jgi:hypothetical protein